MILKKAWLAFATIMTLLAGGSLSAFAEERRIAVPEDGQMGFQAPATVIMERVDSFHDMLLWIILIVTAFVFILLGYVFVKFNRKANPTPTTTTHNTFIEVLWTTAPIIILIVIAVPSFRLLYLQDEIPEADIVIQATGNQWYWTYEYPDEDGLTFDAIIIPPEFFGDDANPVDRNEAAADIARMLGRDTPPPLYRLLDTDTRMVVPINKKVKVLVTATDVIHAWTIPAFGVKVDAVPGRMNELWFEARELGTFYGQCSELCGKDHAYMPIAVEVVTDDEYAAWLARARTEYADAAPVSTHQLAANGQPATR